MHICITSNAPTQCPQCIPDMAVRQADALASIEKQQPVALTLSARRTWSLGVGTPGLTAGWLPKCLAVFIVLCVVLLLLEVIRKISLSQ